MCVCVCVCVYASHSCGFTCTCIGAGTYVQVNCIVCEHVEANEGGIERATAGGGDRFAGPRGAGGKQ